MGLGGATRISHTISHCFKAAFRCQYFFHLTGNLFAFALPEPCDRPALRFGIMGFKWCFNFDLEDHAEEGG